MKSAGSRTGPREIDFQNHHWSVPGGVDIQFGVMGVARSADHIWFSRAASVGGTHQLKTFEDKGKLDGAYVPGGDPLDSGIGLFVKVWGHKMAPMTIRSAIESIEVVLRSDGSLDAAKADPASVRLGPRGAAPVRSHVEQVDGQTALSWRFVGRT